MKSFTINALLAGSAILVAPAFAQKAKPAAQTPGKAIETALPTEVFAAIPFMASPQLSPDGTKIAVTMGVNNVRSYAVIPVGATAGKPEIFATAGAFKNEGDRDVFSYRWVGNDNVVLTLGSRENINGERVDLLRLVAYNVTTKKMTQLAWTGASADASDILHVDHDKAEILLARQTFNYGTERAFRPEVIRVDVKTGKIVEVVLQPNPIVSNWFADGKGVVRMGFGSDRDTGKTRILYRSNGKENFRTISNVADKDFTGAGINPSVFLKEPDMAIVTDNRSGHSKVYRANLKTLELGEPIFEMKGYDVGGVLSNEDQNDVLGYSYATDRGYVNWVEPKLKQVQNFLDEEFGKGNAEIASTSKGDTKLIVDVADPSQASGYYLYDVPTGSFRLLGWGNGGIKDGKANPVKNMVYKASDGMEIHMAVTTPRHRQNVKNLPVVVLTHGGPYGVRDYAEFDPWAQAIAELGYVVVQPNYRGSGGYGTAFLKAGRNDGFGTRMQDDLNDAVDHLARIGVVDAKRACMMGWSYGGYASARAAQRDPDRWRCTIAGAGVYDLPMMRSYDQQYLGSFGSNYLAKGAAELSTVSPARNAKGRWSPILIIHGVRDPRVPIAQSRTLVSALKGAGKKKGVDYEYIEQPRNGHYGRFFTQQESMEWLGGARDWLAKHNPAYIASDADKPRPVATAMK